MAYVIGKIHRDSVEGALRFEAFTGDSPDGLPALLRASMTGNTPAVEALLGRGLDVNARDEKGRTPLMEAAFGGHAETIELLLNRGADVDAQDDDGWTALMEATSKSYLDAVRTLLSNGANPNTKTRNGWTALKATPRGNVEIARLLKQASSSL